MSSVETSKAWAHEHPRYFCYVQNQVTYKFHTIFHLSKLIFRNAIKSKHILLH